MLYVCFSVSCIIRSYHSIINTTHYYKFSPSSAFSSIEKSSSSTKNIRGIQYSPVHTVYSTLSHLVYFLNHTQSSSKSSLLGIIHLSCLSNMLSTSGRLWFWGQETRGRRSLPASSLPSPGGPVVLPIKWEVRGSSPEKILKFYIAVGEF